MHGTFKGEPPRRDHGGGRRAGLALAFRILLREAAVGVLLFATLGQDARTDAISCAVVGAGLVVLTRRPGLLGRRVAMGVATEILVILCGALVFRNLLILLPGLMAGRN